MMDELLEARRLAARLRRIRVERGLSLRGAAAKIGVTKETLSDLERARRHPHPPTLAKIAEGYGVEISDLLGPMVEEEPALASKDEAPKEAGPTTHVVDEDPVAAGLTTHVVSGGGIQSSATGGGYIYRYPTEEEWAEFVRELEDLQHDIAAGEKSKGVAWDTVVGTMDSFKQRG